MPEPGSNRREPRIRKTAPTVREMATAKQSESEPVSRRSSVILRVLKWPFAKVAHSDNRLAKTLRSILRPVGKILQRLVPRYFINSWRELKQVTWPGRRETWRLTAAVFVFAIVFGVMIYLVDLALDKLFRETVLR